MTEENLSLKYFVLLSPFARDQKLVRQIEYYFSNENLPGDTFLFHQCMNKNSCAWISVSVLQTFRKITNLHFTDDEICWAVMTYSTQLEVDRFRKKIRRKYALPPMLTNEKLLHTRSLEIKRIEGNKSVLELEKEFSEFGKIRCVRIEGLQAIVEFQNDLEADDALKKILEKGRYKAKKCPTPVYTKNSISQVQGVPAKFERISFIKPPNVVGTRTGVGKTQNTNWRAQMTGHTATAGLVSSRKTEHDKHENHIGNFSFNKAFGERKKAEVKRFTKASHEVSAKSSTDTTSIKKKK